MISNLLFYFYLGIELLCFKSVVVCIEEAVRMLLWTSVAVNIHSAQLLQSNIGGLLIQACGEVTMAGRHLSFK